MIKRILFIVPSLRVGSGITTFSMNYYKKFGEDFHIDFLAFRNFPSLFTEEIQNNGGSVYFLPSLKKPIKVISFLNNFFKENHYNIVHCNLINLAPLFFYFARKNGINIRILHSHFTESGESFFKKIRNDALILPAKHMATEFFACSYVAGREFFNDSDFSVIRNAIDLDKFSFSRIDRKFVREKYHIEDELVLLTVGRLALQKNPFFILEILTELKKYREFKFFWIGDGDLFNEIFSEIEKKKLQKNIIFIKNISSEEIKRFYSASDVFILPSKYEGLPLVGVEAEANGIPCLFSDTISDELKMNDNVSYLPIDNVNSWVELLISRLHRSFPSKRLVQKYDINSQIKVFEEKYLELIEGDKK
ncbi:glycosyltransferase [Enterococcus avium]|uniref:glycosyltransferase n=1 Tax=Enterococcus avium TaxID=33945 RepID=UPI0037B55E3D